MASITDDSYFLEHCRDLARIADARGCMMYSDFLTAEQQALVLAQQKKWNVMIEFEGGYKEAERKIASFCPLFLQDEEKCYPMTALKIRQKGAQFAKKELSHRDYLGSVLGCGIDRMKTGDILISDDHAVIFVEESIALFLKTALTQVSSAAVITEDFEGNPEELVPAGKQEVISVASTRLDAMVAHGFHLGRNEAALLIRNGRVQINHIETMKIDAVLNEGDLITVRGKGRMKFLEIRGNSKSGRMMILAEIFR